MNEQSSTAHQPSSSLGGSNSNGTAAGNSYFSPPPALSLPKGGGAIKGMGEKFAANPVTGTGAMSVPIATSPGRSGFAPQLSLSYDSGAGNEVFGLGWSLSLPSITRKTDKGLPRYGDAEESDVFILSGAEDLVPGLKSDGAVDETLRDGYRIRKYRPRIEGLFARIERWIKLDSGETHWRSISKDNITTLYGKTAESCIANPDDPRQIFSWLICESYDDKGNAIHYEYKAENSEGVDTAQAHERNRTPESRSANRYLKRIKYGNRVSRLVQPDLMQADWLFEVVLDYGEHDSTDPKPDDPGVWSVRNDPFSSYRAGFEVRTYRLCQRVLMFHHFPEEAGVGEDCLVRSLDFTYSYEQNPTNVRNPIYSLLLSVKQTGYKRNPEGGYIEKSLPPLEFSYSEANIDETVREVEPASLENLPQGLDGTRYQWVDLDGEGLSGILTEQGNGWFYKRNLSPINTVKTNGSEHIEARFAPVELVASKPALPLNNGAQFLDLAGDGQLDLVALRSPTPGFYERTHDEGWESFVAFKSLPNLDWDNPNLKFIDLDGDGHSDILITEDNCFVWYPSLAEDGFGAAERVHQPWDEEQGPRVVFADSTQSIHLADMSGDGLTDIVRIRNGEVCYWPNLGYGRFGAKVTMDNAPLFDYCDIFNQKRIVLADIDGSGTTDILYLSGKGVQVYFNQSGNGWSVPQVLSSFPAIDSLVSVTTLDLLGNGTACLVWSSPLPEHGQRVMRYIDLMGGQKPHLLVKTVNNMGAETVVQYAPSTKFYLEDEQRGKPWITKLPFPVHVVERVETYDRISRNRFVTRYAYHHGYFDGVEREFRGFGMVEQWDTEEIGTIKPEEITSETKSDTNLDAASFVPPVLTKTWFHTGVYIDRDRISQQFEREYYREPNESKSEFAASLLPDTILPDDLTAEEEREAARSLKGRILRQEIYALDGSDKKEHPYSVSERNYEIRSVQSLGKNHHAVFFTHDRETVDYHYERSFILDLTDPEPDLKKKRKIFDPRVTHAMTLEVDAFGNGLKSVAIAYPRRIPRFPEQGQIQGQPNKGKPLITYTENRVTNKPNGDLNNPDWYRIGVPIETRTYEITGLEITSLSSFVPYSLDFIRNKLQEIESRLQETNPIAKPEIAYEEAPDGSLQRRIIERVRTLYRKDSEANTTDPTPLPLGQIDSLALPCESFKLAFTPGLLAQVYSSKIASSELNTLLINEGKYVQQDTGWWIPSGRQDFDPNRFYLTTQMKDPFGMVSSMRYDNYSLLVIESQDALPQPLTNEVKIRNNYRAMQPEMIIDPNGNRVQVIFDALGMVAGTAVMGKESDVPQKGDRLTADFRADLTQAEIDAFLANPLTMAASLLGEATTRIIYDLEQFRTDGQPLVAATIAREVHVSNLLAGTQSKVQVSFSYSDGFGREVQKKIQAERGNAPERQANTTNPNRPGKLVVENGQPKLVLTDTRWVGNGRTIFNNKGKPVKQYEPFFSSTHLYEDEPEMVMTGVTSILFYDPLGRVVATLHPNHTYEKVVFDPWQQVTWDVNDTVVQTEPNTIANDPKTDPHVGEFFRRLPDRDYLPTWYSRFSTSAIASERDAAQKALAHVGTPAIAHLDTLGRTFLTIADNGGAGTYETRVELDIEGNQLVITDARKNAVMIYAIMRKDAQGQPVKDAQGKPIMAGRAFDLLGHNLYSYSMDAGDRWMLNNVAGKPIRAWNDRETRSDLPQPPKGHVARTVYDALQRPTHLYMQATGSAEILVERLVYGEGHPQALQRNLKGKPFQHYDGAGVVSNWEFDFKGNSLRGSRQLAKEYKQPINWRVLAGLTKIPQLVQAAQAQLEPKTFDNLTQFDALNRPVQLTTPDKSVIHPGFNEANLLERMEVQLRGAAARTVFVANIDYDAKGQRQGIEYGNGVKTEYRYDPQTFRLVRLVTRRVDAGAPVRLQDLNYTYDPVGNITAIQDAAQQEVFFDNVRVVPMNGYTYDALYRLIEATGREHPGQAVDPNREFKPERKPSYDSNDLTRRELPHPNDVQAMREYTERYQYDAVGNILKLFHAAGEGSWQRDYTYAATNNRLLSTTVPGLPNGAQSSVNYSYDTHGNMIQMPHLVGMQWDFKDQLHQVDLGGGGTAYYVYDAAGQRVRKVVEKSAGLREERIYLGGFEVFRRYNGVGLVLERETLHGMDGQRRIALVETLTFEIKDGVGGKIENPVPVIRYQLDNHLGSAALELDGAGQVISYEEYYPYGTTSYQAGRSVAEVSLKRYRYTGKERDEETGLYYHGARYYAAWLGRWTSCDPIGLRDGGNVYEYIHGHVTQSTDPSGTQEKKYPPNEDPLDAGAPLPPPQHDAVDQGGEKIYLMPAEQARQENAEAPTAGALPPEIASQGITATTSNTKVRAYIRQEVVTGQKAELRNNPLVMGTLRGAFLLTLLFNQEKAAGILNSVSGPEPTSDIAQSSEMYTSLALGVAEAGLGAGAKAAASRFKLRPPTLDSGNRFRITVSDGKPVVQLPELNIPMTTKPPSAPNISPFELPLPSGSKTVAATPGGPITLSGWGKGSQIPGLGNPSRQVYDYSKLVGHPLEQHGLDAFAGVKGGYGASHAERQALVLNPTAQSVTVSKPPCFGCQKWFRAESTLQGRDIPLFTPGGVYNFQSNGTLWITPLTSFF